MRMHNLMEYSDNYSGSAASLWQYCKGEPKDSITDYYSFKFEL